MPGNRRNLVLPAQRQRPAWAIVGVFLGLLVATGITYFTLVFLVAPEGSISGAWPRFNHTFKPIVLAVYASLALLSIILLTLGRSIAALVIAWLPGILVLFSREILAITAFFP